MKDDLKKSKWKTTKKIQNEDDPKIQMEDDQKNKNGR